MKIFNISFIKIYILAMIIGNIHTELKLRQHKFRKLFYENRRWFVKSNKFKYILVWATTKSDTLFNTLRGSGIEPFTNANCSHSNCIISCNNTYNRDSRYFDAIIFSGPDYWLQPSLFDKLPKARMRKQNYIFYSTISAGRYTLCDEEFDDFFNLTWTYKLNSDLPSPSLFVRNNTGAIIAPKKDVHWKKIDDMLPIDRALKKKLDTKTRAVAWLALEYGAGSEIEIFINKLRAKLKLYYELDIDIYGKRYYFKCDEPVPMSQDCWEVIQSDYYFYLSFENTTGKDFVTKTLLNPLQHYTVPIVYGSANYTRFLPDGAYLNANVLGVAKLANEINDIIKDKERYYSFFKWHNHYSVHDPLASPETNPLCALCKLLNQRPRKKTYQDFRRWWNGAGVCPTKLRSTTENTIFL